MVTKYEVVAKNEIVEKRIRLGFIARNSQSGLAAFLKSNVAFLYDTLALADDANVDYAPKAADGFVAEGGWKIFIGSMTEHDAKVLG